MWRDGVMRETQVRAVSKRFAIWNAEETFGPFYWTRCERITASRMRNP